MSAGGDVEAGMQFDGWINSTGLFEPAVVEDHWVPAGPHKLFAKSAESFTMRSDITVRSKISPLQRNLNHYFFLSLAIHKGRSTSTHEKWAGGEPR